VEHTVGRPFRLEDRLLRAASHEVSLAEGAVGANPGEPKLRAVPRHVGVIPREPRDTRSVRADPRRRVEVASPNEDASIRPPVERHRDNRGLRLRPDDVVVFADADQPPASAVEHGVGVAHLPFRRERPRLTAGAHRVEALVAVVREIDLLFPGEVGTPSVLVDPGPRAPRRGDHIHQGAVRAPAHDDVAPAFPGARLGPEDRVRRQRRLAQEHRLGCDPVRRDRGSPGSMGGDAGRSHGIGLQGHGPRLRENACRAMRHSGSGSGARPRASGARSCSLPPACSRSGSRSPRASSRSGSRARSGTARAA